MFDSIFSISETGDTVITIPLLIAAIATSVVLGLLISLVHTKSQKGKGTSQSFALTLVMLPAVVTVIILLVGSNVARAFSLAGAFSIIRFRSAAGGTKDITYVLFTMAVGLACGMGYLLYAAIVAVTLCAVMVALELSGFGKGKDEKTLRISIPEDLDYNSAFESVWNKYTTSHDLMRMKTTNLGSMYELQYTVVTRQGIDEKRFIDELRCRNGNLNIALILKAVEGDF